MHVDEFRTQGPEPRCPRYRDAPAFTALSYRHPDEKGERSPCQEEFR